MNDISSTATEAKVTTTHAEQPQAKDSSNITIIPAPQGWRTERDPPFYCSLVNVNLPGGNAELELNLVLSATKAKPFIDAGNRHFADFQTKVDALIRETKEYADWQAASAKVKKLVASADEYRKEIDKNQAAIEEHLRSPSALDDADVFGDGDLKEQLAQIQKTLARVVLIEAEAARALHLKTKSITNVETDIEIARYLDAEKDLAGLIQAATDALNGLISLQCRRDAFLNSGLARQYADQAIIALVGRMPEYPLPEGPKPTFQPIPQFAGILPQGPGAFVGPVTGRPAR